MIVTWSRPPVRTAPHTIPMLGSPGGRQLAGVIAGVRHLRAVR